MAEDRIDSIIDQKAIDAEVQHLDQQLNTMLAKIKEFSTLKISFNQAGDVSGLNDAQKKLTKGQTELSLAVKEYEKIVNGISTKQAKLNALTSDAATELAKLKLQEQQVNQARKDSIKLDEAKEGSIAKLRVELKLAQQEYDNLSKAERESSQGKGSLQKIQQLDAELKQLEGTTGRFQRNVGNYQGSAAIIVQALERTRQKFTELNRDSRSSPEAVSRVKNEMEALQRVVDQPNFLNVAAKFGDANAEAKFFMKTLTDLERQGLGNSESANQLRQQLAQLTDAINDTREEVRALSSDTRGFDLFAQSVSALVNVTQTAVGIQAIFGEENENVQKSIQRLIAIQNVANGVQALATQLTQKGTAVQRAYAFVQGQVAILTNASTTATQKFGAAFKLTGIGLAITAIGLLADKMGLFGGSTSSATKELENFNTQLERTNRALEGNISDIQFKTRLAIENAKKRGASESEISNLTIQGYKDEANAYRAAADDKVEKAKQFFNAQGIVITSIKDAEEALGKLEDIKGLDGIGGFNLTKDFKARIDGAIEAAKDVRANLIAARDADRQASQEQAAFDAQQTQKSIELARKAASEKQKAELELAKFRADLLAEEQRALAEFNKSDLASKKINLQAELAIRLDVIEQQRQFDIDELARTRSALAQKHELTAGMEQAFNAQRILINERADQQIRDLQGKLSAELIAIRGEELEAEKERLKDIEDEFAAHIQRKLEIAQAGSLREFGQSQLQLERQRQQDRQNALDNFANGLTTREQLATRLADIDQRAHQASLEANVIFYQQQLKQLQDAGVDTLEAEQQLANAKAAVQDSIIQQRLEAVNVETDLIQQLNDKYLALAETISTTFATIVGGVFDGQKNRLQEQLDLVNELKAAEIDRINETTASAEEKAAKIKIVEAQAQNQREDIERRQKEIDRRKALFERAFSGFQIVMGGIESVAKIKGTVAELTARAVGNPLLLPLIPIAAAQIPLTIAMTAAQLVALAATPLPKFRHGTKDAPAGLGVWGEVGQEMMVDRRGRISLSPKGGPSLVQLMGGETIIPHERTKDILRSLGMEGLIGGGTTINMDQSGLLAKTGEVVDQLRELNGKPQIIIHNHRDITTTAWYAKEIKN